MNKNKADGMVADRRTRLLQRFIINQRDSGVAESDDQLVCPLCWTAKPLGDFSLEHIVPKAVGGRRTTLTCACCNNEHGSALDAHLSKFQAMKDAFAGRGVIPGTMNLKGREVAINFQSGPSGEGKHIRIVGPASHPKHVGGIHDDLEEGSVDQFKIKLFYGYNKNRMQTALLRIGYLAVFHRFGYRYAMNPLIQIVRERILDPDAESFRLASFVAAIPTWSFPFEKAYFIIPGKLDELPFFQIVIRCRAKTTSYHSVTLPGLESKESKFFDEYQAFTAEQREYTIKGLTANDILD